MASIYIILAAFCWGTLGVVSVFGYQDGLTPLEAAFWRGAVGGAAFFIHALFIRKLTIKRSHIPLLIAFSIFAVLLLNCSYQLAVDQGGAAFAAILLYSSPAWVAMISRIVYREKFTLQKAMALLLVMVGVSGVALAGSAEIVFSNSAIMWGVLSGVGYALYCIFSKFFFRHYHASTLFMYAFPLASLFLVPFVEFHAPTPRTWLVILFIGVVTTYFANYFYSLGLRRLTPTKVAIMATAEPVFANILAFFIWGEHFGGWGYFFAACVVAGVLLVSVDFKKGHQNDPN